MKKVIVSEAVSDSAIAELRRLFDVHYEPALWKQPQALAELLADAHALLVRNQTQVSAELIAAANKLEIIGRAGAGLDNIDVTAATNAGVVVASTPHHNAISVAELTIGLVLALARMIPQADRDTKLGGWNRKRYTGIELNGKTLGIVGFGRIGFLTAMRAKALGMHVLAYDPYVDPHSTLIAEAGARLTGLDDLLAMSDIVCCHLPSSVETRGIFDASRFAKMKSGSLFVNVARGGVVSEPALIDALQSGHLRAAALDVRESEPPQPSVLNQMQQVILTPHIGAFTIDAQQRVEAAVCHDIVAVLSGQPAMNPVHHKLPVRNSGRLADA
jgi:D-3-phosphoglycerate dehydrogenase